jgi:PAS domain-containing protein
MTDSKPSLASSFAYSKRSRASSTRGGNLKKLSEQQQELGHRVSALKDLIQDKDSVITSQRHSIRHMEQQIAGFVKQISSLRQVIEVLSRHITEELNERLPPLPPVSETQDFPMVLDRPKVKLASLDTQKPKHRRQKPPKALLFDSNLSLNMFEEFKGAEFLKQILDAQLNREEMKKTTRFLLGKASHDVFLFKTKTVLFESLSFFMSLKNVAISNKFEVFLPRALEMLVDLLEVERVVVYLLDDSTKTYYSRAVTADLPRELVFPVDMGHFAHSSAPIIIDNAYEDARFDSQYDRAGDSVTHNLAAVPLKANDCQIGVLECSNKQVSFTKRDLALLSLVARHIGQGFGAQQLRDSLWSLNSLNSTTRNSIDSGRESLLFPLLEGMLETAVSLTKCERATVFLYDETSKEMYSYLGTKLDGVIRIPVSKGLSSLAYTTKSVVNVERAETHPMFYAQVDLQTNFLTKEVLVVPFQRTQGVLQCLNKQNLTPFTKTDEERVKCLAGLVDQLFTATDNLEGLLTDSDFNELCLQAVNEAILHVNMNGVLHKVNRYAAELFQLTAERMVGMTITELLSENPEILSEFEKTVKRQASTQMKANLTVSRETQTALRLVVNVSFVLMKGQHSSYVLLLRRKGHLGSNL